ncbi:translational GTPase TypA [candidate division WWE3 bacterium CG08_land_8_20_14_0_20_40_13]|uniref:50S ribosomal subunit assembly factor BipA n=1 Tax=candidate division WWE3 bacterium CG08_land_8_20_14_0_20_40_13 TaxID=1975084 RepID=A0A2H0XFH9_UNCKA|nr:MAG: translational GTPase TypA [candidate division WWE3 bacterium CG08_land_8_20_14_0_20_40_13]
MKLRNIAIIAHVDHGKTTIVDGLLKQSKNFRDNEAIMSQDLIMDSNDQEKERGITILAKNVSIIYKDTKINIIDTPGHADFGGEVERTLNMADGALLVVDAQEGPMPQTKFVLKKALELNLKIIVIINKIDKPNADVKRTLSRIYDLFLELATHEDQLTFPILYATGKDGKAWDKMPDNPDETANFTQIFETVLKYVPEPQIDPDGPFQMLVSALDWDNYKGKYIIGKVKRGTIKLNDKVAIIKTDKTVFQATANKIYVYQGLKRQETDIGLPGDIIAIAGIKEAEIGDTISNPQYPNSVLSIKLEEPTLSLTIGPNTSPLMGKEGKFVTGRQILERIQRELQTNIAMRFKIAENGKYTLFGRGELHLSVFLETLRREGYEIEVSKPTVITKIIDREEMEPIDELTCDVDNQYIGAVKSEIGKRRGILLSQDELSSGTTRMTFQITTRGLLGLRGTLLTLTRGTAVISSIFIKYDKIGSKIQRLRKGVIVASNAGKAATYGLVPAHDKGPVFIKPQTIVYEGMIVGINARDEDVEINVCKEKQLTNNRSVGEEGIVLPPSLQLSLEQQLSFLEDDELLEITPQNLRLRKKILDTNLRRRQVKRDKN